MIIMIFFMTLSIIVLIFYLTIMILKKISFELARKIEIFGYFLLCVVLAWELVFKNLLMAKFYTLDIFYLNQKITVIFNLLINSIDTLTASKLFYIDIEKEYVENQLFITDIIENILKIVSTYCISFGRLSELINKE